MKFNKPALRSAAEKEVLKIAVNGPLPSFAVEVNTTKVTIGLLGTFDVDNYGDLLLPAIFQRVARQFFPNLETKLFSPKGGVDRFDGLPIHPLADLEHLHNELDAFVIGGDDVIRFDRSAYADEDIPVHVRMLLLPALHGISSCKPAGWNALGVPYPFTMQQQEALEGVLELTSYVSVRDPVSKNHLDFSGREVAVVPDSSFLLPVLFPRERLAPIAAALKKRLGLTGAYAVFHMSQSTAFAEGLPVAAEQMRIVAERLKIPVLLLPLGPVHGEVALLSQMKECHPSHFQMTADSLHPLEVAALIAHSELFVGTSLHGNITAFAYGVPGVAVNPRLLAKLNHFGVLTGRMVLNSWERLADVTATLERNLPTAMDARNRLLQIHNQIQDHFCKLLCHLTESRPGLQCAATSILKIVEGMVANDRVKHEYASDKQAAELNAVKNALDATRSKLDGITQELDAIKMQFEATKLQNFRMHRSLTAAKLQNYKMQHSWVWLPLKPLRHLEKMIRRQRKRFAAKWSFNGRNNSRKNPASRGGKSHFVEAAGQDYSTWIQLYDTLTPDDARRILKHISQLSYQPLISLLMPTYNTPETFLRKAIESVRQQFYEQWELCIADDASTEPHVREVLQDYQKIDPRIKVTFRNGNGHISEASNSALELATGAFVALFDHDDELAPHALYALVNELSHHPDADIIYSDFDQLNEDGERESPYFKTDWNPDLLLSHNYICHLAAYRTECVRQAGGFRVGFEGSQDWDLSLRVSEQTTAERIRHIPQVLYHWRRHAQSTSVTLNSKPYAIASATKAIREHLERKKRNAKVIETQFRGWSRVRYEIEEPPLVSIIICTLDRIDLLGPCVTSILARSRYPNYEVLIVDNNSRQQETLDYLNHLKKSPNIRILKDAQPFNYSALNNDAVPSARGDVLCFMNNDTEVISADWLYEMVSHAVRDEIGAVGAKLLYPDNRVQHAGVVLGIGGVADHVFCGMSADAPGYMGRAQLIQNYTAVTGACMVLRKAVFEEVGGFNQRELKVAFSDIDLCLKIHAAGYRNLWTPYAVLYHHESSTRGNEDTPSKAKRAAREIAYMGERWKELLYNDPAYNPNLALTQDHFGLAFPPRVSKPWLMA